MDSDVNWLAVDVDRLETPLLVASTRLFTAETAAEVMTDSLDSADETPVSEVATALMAPFAPEIWPATTDEADEADRIMLLSEVETICDCEL